jgi:hypothetical protein
MDDLPYLKMVIGIQTLKWHGEVIWMRDIPWGNGHQPVTS